MDTPIPYFAPNPSMPVTTTFTIEGYRIRQYLGVVRGIIVRSPTISQGFFGGLKSIIGGNIGGRLARQDKDITFIDVDPEHVQAIRNNGLQVDVPDGNFNIRVPILFSNEIEGKFDLAFIAVRTNYTGNAVNSIVPYLAENGLLG